MQYLGRDSAVEHGLLVYRPTIDAVGDANTVVTTTQLINGYIIHTLTAPRTTTTPTAAAIVAAINGCVQGMSFLFNYRVVGASTGTLTAAAGVTFNVAGDAVVTGAAAPDGRASRWLANVTNTTSGSEAVVLYRVG